MQDATGTTTTTGTTAAKPAQGPDDDRAPPKVFAYECRVDAGSPDRTLRQAPALGVAAPRTVFDGECYLCVSEGHSQNYCPLSRCHTCHRYGHTERACCFAARPWGFHTTTAAAATVVTNTAKIQRRVYDRRSVFGSGWHGAVPARTGVVGWR
ncbi:hypothetical protein pdul_cds_418 [Pandoravirus dulcis]|uniref:CCHC-type domain-containing protein n=1 Tax=Pandoravirus dulcis TaxID=1349409 RepID=S4VX55_9VIRU|nr:hypothetical protein pdul_cds_418 [Pandoravirus dulcis]AGO82469.1 hypothetical protein pdul_cds_418 [Pandoravirus dulcis]